LTVLVGCFALNIDDQHFGARPREQNCCRPAIADPVIGRTAAGDDCHFAVEAEIVVPPLLGHRYPPQRAPSSSAWPAGGSKP